MGSHGGADPLHDTRTGHLITTAPFPAAGQHYLVAIDATGRRFLTQSMSPAESRSSTGSRHALGRQSSDIRVCLWDLASLTSTAATRPLEPVGQFQGIDGALSPDGRHVAVRTILPGDGTVFSGDVTVHDFDSRAPRFSQPGRFATFSTDSRRVTFYQDRLWNPTTFDAVNGAPLAPDTPFPRPRFGVVSPDGTTTACVRRFKLDNVLFTSPLATPSGGDTSVHVDDLATASALTFFPDSARLLAPGPAPASVAVYAAPSLRPLAIVRGLRGAADAVAVAPNGQRFAVLSHLLDGPGAPRQTLTFFHRTGPDCPESHLGALAFPHLWLLTALFTALALTLRRDARRSAYALPTSINFLSIALLVAALPRTLHCLIATLIGERVLTPAPLLLLAAILLATGARTYRRLTLTLLALILPLEAYSLHLLRRAGLGESSSILLFDRTYDIPHIAPFVVLTAACAAIPAAIYLLARRPA